jgi:hypothetical protein
VPFPSNGRCLVVCFAATGLHAKILSRVVVTIDGVLDWMIGFNAPDRFTTRDYRQYSAITDLHTLQFTVAHALGFSVFSSRILATDFTTVSLSLQITHEVFFVPPKSFLAIILQLPIPKTRINSIPHILAGWRPDTRLFTLLTARLYCRTLLVTTLHGPRSKHSFYCWGGVFTARLPSNRRPTVARECVYRDVA